MEENLNANKKLVWTGRVISTLTLLPFLFSAGMKFMRTPQVIQGMEHLGIPSSLLTTLAILELLCIIFYAIPMTSVLGAILLTGYLGGAICTHLRVGENVYLQVLLGVLIWLGLYLRDSRLKNLLPLRKL